MYADGENMPRRSICSLRHIFASSIIFLSCDIFRAKGGTVPATFVPPVLVKIYHPKVRGWQKRGSLADLPLQCCNWKFNELTILIITQELIRVSLPLVCQKSRVSK